MQETVMEAHFEEVITTSERLRELNNSPSDRVRNKAIDHIDEICRRFIAACPFVMVASHGADGRLDLSPKGDPLPGDNQGENPASI
jgi:predicted pyridoxine 5'-phosphate oxidase superfamily flavin-nucleotide-binding protein